MPGWMRRERQGVEWQGMRKPTVMVSGGEMAVAARLLEEEGGGVRWCVVYWERR